MDPSRDSLKSLVLPLAQGLVLSRPVVGRLLFLLLDLFLDLFLFLHLPRATADGNADSMQLGSLLAVLEKFLDSTP